MENNIGSIVNPFIKDSAREGKVVGNAKRAS